MSSYLPGVFPGRLEFACHRQLFIAATFKTLLELTVLLETMLFGHLSLFLFGLYDAAFLTEILHGAVEDAILAELALQ